MDVTFEAPGALQSFTAACKAATEVLTASESIAQSAEGISLLDAKNEIFLSYLQALALRNFNVIQSLRDGSSTKEIQKLSDDLTSKLVEHRVYLERGIRPLEQKIKYQVDKVVKAADDEERLATQKASKAAAVKNNEDGGIESGSSDEDESDEEEEEEDGETARPNASGFGQSNGHAHSESRQAKSKEDGVYRPPRISATSMPTTEQRERKQRGPGRSSTIDEFVAEEISSAPLAQPSIGSTIAQGGRRTKGARQLAREQERTDYEETHLVRLPNDSKKELAKQRAKERRGGYGGEEWNGLGAAVDRIGEMTKKKSKGGVLERSRKRRAVEDGPRNDGVGDAFDVKKRRVMKKMKR